ncbi:hypothetical protein SFC55_24865 [Niallia taxi]|uniref:hypothetical protein n=1 Tax=Niallia taxi TaxID=2499688 RepID=UPI00398250C0
MRNLIGIVILALSVILGLACAFAFQQETLGANIMLWVFGLPLYISGQIIRTSKYEFKHKGKHWIGIYLFFFFIIPLLIYLNELYSDLKETTFIDEQFIIYEPSSGMLGELSIGGFVIIIFLFGARFLNPELKRKWLLNSIIIVTVALLVGFNYLMFSDYRGIHEEKGLITSNWKGERQLVSYDEIESIYLKPYVHYASLSNSSDETRFVWTLTFQPSNQKEIIYRFRLLTGSGLEETIAIKKLALKNNVKFIVGEMNQETFQLFNEGLEYEELEKDRYYQLFQVTD